MLRTQIYLPVALRQELFILAKKEDLSMAELIRQFVQVGIKTRKMKKRSGDTLLSIANTAVKGLPKNLSKKHDDYLYG